MSNTLTPDVVAIIKRYHRRQSNNGKRGGAVRSEAKRRAAKENLRKARAKRWERHQSMTISPEQSNRPSREADAQTTQST